MLCGNDELRSRVVEQLDITLLCPQQFGYRRQHFVQPLVETAGAPQPRAPFVQLRERVDLHLETSLAFLQREFRPLALRDIARDLGGADDEPAGIPDRRYAERDR